MCKLTLQRSRLVHRNTFILLYSVNDNYLNFESSREWIFMWCISHLDAITVGKYAPVSVENERNSFSQYTTHNFMDPHSRASKKNASHGNEALPQDTTHLIQRPCYQRGGPCQDPAGNWPSWRDPNRSGMDMSPVYQVWPKPSCKAQWKGGRRQGRQKKRWEDNIREWTGLEFAKSQRAVQNWQKWRILVVKSYVVPQRPSRLRDRCERWEWESTQSGIWNYPLST